MGSKSRFGGIDHEHWVRKNENTARAENKREKVKDFPTEEKTCQKCNKVKVCSKFKAYKSKDVVSFGGDSNLDCSEWVPVSQEKVSDKKVKTMLKQFKNMLR